jgi:hypothetical protein
MKKKIQVVNALAVILAIAVFTPLLLPKGVYLPMLFGLPYTLWMGILATILFIILTWCSAVMYKKMEEEEQP